MTQPDQQPDFPTAAGLPFAPILGVLMLLALLLRAWGVGAAPLHPDEIHYAYDWLEGAELGSLSAIRDLDCAFLVERRTAHPMAGILPARWLWLLPLGWAFDGTAGFLRFFSVLVGTATVPVAYLAGCLLGGPARGLLAAGLVALHPGLIWISRTLYLDPMYTFYLAWMYVAVGGLLTRRDWGWGLLLGVAYGFFASTKISAPMLGPAFLVGAFLAPAGMGWKERLPRALLAGGAALLVFLLFVDPAAYLSKIIEPSDPRYGAEWEANGLGGYLLLAFAMLDSYLPTVAWDAPLTGWLLAGWAVVLAARGRQWREAYFLFALLLMTPLIFMHHITLSGPHGYAPVWLTLGLLASGVAGTNRPRMLLGVLGVHAALCVVIAGARAAELPPFFQKRYCGPEADPVYQEIRGLLHRRSDPRPQIVFLRHNRHAFPTTPYLRSAQLTEGAIGLLPAGSRAVTGEIWGLADMVVAWGDDALPAMPPEFEPRSEAAPWIFRRIGGTARRSFAVADLTPAPDADVPAGARAYLLPGPLLPIAGGLALNGTPLRNDEAEAAEPPYYRGFVNWGFYGEGTIILPDGTEGMITLTPPNRDQVFWKF